MDSEDEISVEEEIGEFPEALILVPPEASSFEGFRAWSQAKWFPMHGRIDFVAGGVDIELNPEDLFTHGTAKIAIGSGLHFLVTRRQLTPPDEPVERLSDLQKDDYRPAQHMATNIAPAIPHSCVDPKNIRKARAPSSAPDRPLPGNPHQVARGDELDQPDPPYPLEAEPAVSGAPPSRISSLKRSMGIRLRCPSRWYDHAAQLS